MRKRTQYLLLALGGAGLLYWLSKSSCTVSSAISCATGSITSFFSNMFPSNWLASGAAYVPTINTVEGQYGLPQNYLAAVAYQESNFNPGAYNAGSRATGMFQLLPQYYPTAGQSWQADAATAASALAGYYREFGDWQLALAAYNWGPGNLTNYLNAGGAGAMPSETQNYVTRIAGATGVPGSLVA